jgi:D-serine deaminase-like pyridoxal phosphate-dependent protein
LTAKLVAFFLSPRGEDTRMATVPGQLKGSVDTPALLVDLDVMERNINRMQGTFRRGKVNWRPHIKSIKVPLIAHMLLRMGASGITCAKVSEAEVMAESGIQDILIANEIVGAQKIARLISLRQYCNVMVCVDSLQNCHDLSAAATASDVTLRVLVEVDIGLGRCGVRPGSATVELARQICDLPGLRLTGLMGWEGHLAPLRASREKEVAINQSVGELVASAEACRARGLRVEIVSCGGTGTYQYTSTIKGVTEIQAGGGIFGDLTYVDWGADHEFALSVLTTVISRPKSDRVVFDAGRKAISTDFRKPGLKNLAIEGEIRSHAEHSDATIRPSNNSPSIGDVFELIPGYVDTTVCLHHELVAVRNGIVIGVWPILARGRLQ